MNKITVRLQDDTIGNITPDSIDGYTEETIIGEVLNVHLHDENGNPIEKEGKIVEVLEWVLAE